MKLKIKLVLSLAFSFCVLSAAAGCGKTAEFRWELDELGDGVNFHTQAQSDYLSGGYDKISSYAKGTEELSRPEPVRFGWSATPLSQTQAAVESYAVEISTWHDFTESVCYETAETQLDVYNLCVSTDYFWRVTANLSDGTKSVSAPSSFRTADGAPRNLYVDGVTNVRDLGGWETADGRVKQGMIYRCGRLNESETSVVNVEITPQGVDTMLRVLGVRTEIDLRMPDAHNVETGGITSSPLGEQVNYYNIPMDWVMSGNFNYLSDPSYRGAIKKFFGYLADESNYPLIYHCNIGTDRTGLYAFLINGLLGVSEEDLYRDYLFSNFGNIGGARSVANIRSYVDTVKACAGDTLSEKIENCLTEIGVPKADIEALRGIMTE